MNLKNDSEKIEDTSRRVITEADREIGQKATISFAQIIQVKTGTGPFDENKTPDSQTEDGAITWTAGNDVSEDDNIVRSFDQITWTLDLTFALKEGIIESNLTGGKIMIEAELPEHCANIVKWDIETMKWMENAVISEDGRKITGMYSMTEETTTIPGKQTLVTVLKVKGANNGEEIKPDFKVWLVGNEENEKKAITAEKTIVSAKGKYNLEIRRNTELSNKVTVQLDGVEQKGRMYGYGIVVQLHNDNVSKGIKGLEIPTGPITFDIELKLERTKANSMELENITNECTPILWQYRLNEWSENNNGEIANREFYAINRFHVYNPQLPLGVDYGDRAYCTYNSGNMNIIQENNILHVTIENYDFEEIFPQYEASDRATTYRKKIYEENIGTFSVGYMQILVPDNEASTVDERDYYITVADTNMKIKNKKGIIHTEQMNKTDDIDTTRHFVHIRGGYGQDQYFWTDNGQLLESEHFRGDGSVAIGSIIRGHYKMNILRTNDEDVYTANKFIKFDAECYEPIYFDNGDKYQKAWFDGDAEFKVWYITKADGKNWSSPTEMNNTNITETKLEKYENIEDIPQGKLCVGIYLESIDGVITRSSGDNNVIDLRYKIKETAKIGKTYAVVQRTQLWIDKLDRDKYSILHPENEYPKPTWDSAIDGEGINYIKTEYDENGNILEGTHNANARIGNTLLITGADLLGQIKSISGENEKINYDLGKNENKATYKVEPQIKQNPNLKKQIEDIVIKAEITLPKGLTYITGSSKRRGEYYDEPQIEKNADGSTKLTYKIYGCKSGEDIAPITFDTAIDNKTKNGTQYQVKMVVAEVVQEGEESKIGNTRLSYRTSETTINIINLESHRLYKEVDKLVIEKEGEITYKIVYENVTEQTIQNFQMLDIIPYNGNIRGSKYNGKCTVQSINVKQITNGIEQPNHNLSIYTTNSEEARTINAKNEEIGISDIWSQATSGEFTAVAVKGSVAGNTRVEIEIQIKTSQNSSKDKYINNAMAQVYKTSEQIESANVETRVVNREIQGIVWEDTNRNGILDEEETKLEGVTIILLNPNTNTELERATTNEQGEYKFTDLNKQNYKVQIELPNEDYILTQKLEGANPEVNSKFDEETKQTEEITKLNSMQSPEIIERYVNAGICKKQYQITTKVEGTGGTISGVNDEIYEIVNIKEDSKKDIIITPDKNYKVNTITVNGEPIQYTANADKTVTLDKFTNMTENKEVIVTFEKIPVTITVHHYIYKDGYTTNKVPLQDGSIAEDETISGFAGDSYNTQAKQNIAQYYKLYETPSNEAGTMPEIETEINYYYIEYLKDITVTKTWDHTNNIYGNPQSVILQIKNGEQVIEEFEVTQENNWLHTFTQLPIYDETGNEIQYTVGEKEVQEGDLIYYDQTIEGYNITNTYKGPIISSNKTVTTQNSLGYVVEEEKITYAVIVQNAGGLAKDVVIKDTIPEGTTFVEGSIKVNGVSSYELNGNTIDLSTKTAQDLANGITVKVPESTAQTGEQAQEKVSGNFGTEENGTKMSQKGQTDQGEKQNGQVILTFEITVNKGVKGNIENTATVDETSTNKAEKPVVTFEKQATIIRKETNDTQKDTSKENGEITQQSDIKENEVTVGDRIKYTIKVNNTGTTNIENIKVEDMIPKGTKLISIQNEGTQEEDKVNWVISNIEAQTTQTVSFIVEIEYAKEEYIITNVATVDEKATNKTENPYKKPVLELQSNIQKTATNKKVTTKEGKIYYEIQFTATVKDFVGKAKINIVDTLPYAINEDESEIDGGIYDKDTKTIMWEQEVQDINTFMVNQEKEIAIIKRVNLKYIYENLNNHTGSMVNTAKSKIELQEPKTPTEYETVKQEEQQAQEELTIEIPTKVIVHHYIYDAEAGAYTEKKIAEDEEKNGIIGEEYTTSPSSQVPANYVVVDTSPEKHEGKMTEETIEVKYYYKLKTTIITNEISKTAVADKIIEETTNSYGLGEAITKQKQYSVLTQEGGKVSYKINYKAVITDYIGRIKIEITDTLPAKIDIDKSELNGGIYNETDNTISWIEEIQNIDTFANQEGEYEGGQYSNGAYTKQIEKQINLVYVNQNPVQDLTNIVTGTTKIYYPENHPTKPEEENQTEEITAQETVKQEYTVDIKVQKQWEDNNNQKQKRPQSVLIEIMEKESKDTIIFELNEENNWKHEIKGLPKYDENGRKIEYEITEKETNEGDLEYYENPVITKTEIQNSEIQRIQGQENNKMKKQQESKSNSSMSITESENQATTTYEYTVTNTYKLLDTDLNTQITKSGTKEITASAQPVEYSIQFTAEISDYIGSGKVTIVDTLPYKIDETKSNLSGGIYNAENKTITWEQELPHINTEKTQENKNAKESYKIKITKQITVVYTNLDAEQEEMTNNIKGKVELYESEQKDEVEGTAQTTININGNIIVKYVDIDTNQELSDRQNITNKVGTPYETEQKEIEDYIFIRHTNNIEGKIKETQQEVIYYYEKIATNIKIQYVDEEGKHLLEDVIIDGKVGDNYKTEEKQIENYELVEEPENSEGTMTKEEITITYIYRKIPVKVIVKHLEKETNKELLPEEIIQGEAGDRYKTQRKVITNYKAAEPEPENGEGTMKKDETTQNTITVIYYYERLQSGTITVKYVDIDTNREITYKETQQDEAGNTETVEKTYREEIKGKVGEKYKTEAKSIPYYKLIKTPINSSGELTQNSDTVIYYYQKQTFNISVEKEIEKVILNGQEKKITNKKAMKIEIVASNIKQTNLEITYAIKVKNTGEIDATTKIIENIPQGYEVTANTPSYWKTADSKEDTNNKNIKNTTLEATIKLKAGEEKLLKVTLKWINAEEKFGSSKNTVKLTDITNPANYKEITQEDNESSAEIITSVKTGQAEQIIAIIMAAGAVFTGVVLVYLKKKLDKEI